MDIKIPQDLKEAITAIVQLQARSSMAEGQSSLLLAFLTQDLESRKKFLDFTKRISNAKLSEKDENLQRVAKILCQLTQDPPTQETTPPSDGKPSPLSNVLQFPKKLV